jgi:hypothetical protein
MLMGKYLAAQKKPVPDSLSKVVVPGAQYNRSGFHNFLWGRHYRKEWNTPVKFKVINLDSTAGGLTPYESGGSRQTMSLKLHDPQKREYVLRSIDKTFGGALPEEYRKTFIESIVNDQVSIAHPYGAVIVAPLAEAAGIYHTWPRNVYLPKQKALDTFEAKYGNKLYLLEQRADGNWQGAPNFGNSKKIIGTDKLFEKLHESNKHSVDQEEFIKARLFDMFIGDWGRHEDQWRWASFEKDNIVTYKPIPRDRDQAFTKFDGLMVGFVKSVAGLSHQQSFNSTIKNIRTYNYSARNLDRVMTNRMTLEQWVSTAKDLQGVLSDSIISFAVHQMPPEVFKISGPDFISKLKSRRDHLVEFAEGYYEFLAKEVDITGTEKRELFEIKDDLSGAVRVTIYDLDENGMKSEELYHRIFRRSETHEIRLYGWSGEDVYNIELTGKSNITVRIIGGPQTDTYTITSKGNLHIYDDAEQKVEETGNATLHLSADSSIHEYKYDGFKYNKQGISPSLYYSKQHIIYLGIAYKNTKYKWRKQPFASTHEMYLHYSPTQNALRTGYDGEVNDFIGKWNLVTNANFDWVKVVNFFGVGNETEQLTSNRDFYRIRSESGLVSAGLSHRIGEQGNFIVSPYFQTVKLFNDVDRFLIKDFLQGRVDKHYFDTRKFLGLAAALKLQKVDDQVVPTKGYRFTANAAYTKNINEPNKTLSYGGDLHFYFPLSNRFVLAIKNGAATVNGEPEFYQLNSIGGKKLRGYRRERFWGNTSYYNNNELQYLFNFRSFLFNGKAGLMAFADQGRVWLKGEKSQVWHYGYGGGIILSPFNKIYIAASYGISPENKGIIHLDLRRALK